MRVRTPSGEELVIRSERASHGPTLYLDARARRYLWQGRSGFLSYVANTRVEGTSELGRVPIVGDLTNVFPEGLPGVPLRGRLIFGLIWHLVRLR